MRPRRRSFGHVLALACTCLCVLAALLPSAARAQRADPNDPYRYDLRSAVFPVVFVAGLSQRSFGSALRGELDLGRRVTLELSGVLPWAVVGGRDETGTYTASAGLSLHVVDVVERERLEGSVYPKDYAAPTGRGNVGTDSDLDIPISSRMGGPELRAPEHVGGDATAPIRRTHSLRLGYHLGRTVQRGRPDGALARERWAMNVVHALYLGYGFGQAWNLTPAVAGERALGYRRFYLDALLTLDPLVDETLVSPAVPDPADGRPTLFPVGLRLGMQGAIDALLRSFHGFGFAYTVELSALPGRSGLEGRLLIALGVELDGATRASPR